MDRSNIRNVPPSAKEKGFRKLFVIPESLYQRFRDCERREAAADRDVAQRYNMSQQLPGINASSRDIVVNISGGDASEAAVFGNARGRGRGRGRGRRSYSPEGFNTEYRRRKRAADDADPARASRNAWPPQPPDNEGSNPPSPPNPYNYGSSSSSSSSSKQSIPQETSRMDVDRSAAAASVQNDRSGADPAVTAHDRSLNAEETDRGRNQPREGSVTAASDPISMSSANANDRDDDEVSFLNPPRRNNISQFNDEDEFIPLYRSSPIHSRIDDETEEEEENEEEKDGDGAEEEEEKQRSSVSNVLSQLDELPKNEEEAKKRQREEEDEQKEEEEKRRRRDEGEEKVSMKNLASNSAKNYLKRKRTADILKRRDKWQQYLKQRYPPPRYKARKKWKNILSEINIPRNDASAAPQIIPPPPSDIPAAVDPFGQLPGAAQQSDVNWSINPPPSSSSSMQMGRSREEERILDEMGEENGAPREPSPAPFVGDNDISFFSARQQVKSDDDQSFLSAEQSDRHQSMRDAWERDNSSRDQTTASMPSNVSLKSGAFTLPEMGSSSSKTSSKSKKSYPSSAFSGFNEEYNYSPPPPSAKSSSKSSPPPSAKSSSSVKSSKKTPPPSARGSSSRSRKPSSSAFHGFSEEEEEKEPPPPSAKGSSSRSRKSSSSAFRGFREEEEKEPPPPSAKGSSSVKDSKDGKWDYSQRESSKSSTGKKNFSFVLNDVLSELDAMSSRGVSDWDVDNQSANESHIKYWEDINRGEEEKKRKRSESEGEEGVGDKRRNEQESDRESQTFESAHEEGAEMSREETGIPPPHPPPAAPIKKPSRGVYGGPERLKQHRKQSRINPIPRTRKKKSENRAAAAAAAAEEPSKKPKASSPEQKTKGEKRANSSSSSVTSMNVAKDNDPLGKRKRAIAESKGRRPKRFARDEDDWLSLEGDERQEMIKNQRKSKTKTAVKQREQQRMKKVSNFPPRRKKFLQKKK